MPETSPTINTCPERYANPRFRIAFITLPYVEPEQMEAPATW